MKLFLTNSHLLYEHKNVFFQVAWGTAVMELQSWLLYHLVAVTDCNQGIQMLTVRCSDSFP